jgi:hypothetical protein
MYMKQICRCLALALVVTVLVSCAKKQEVIPIPEMKRYDNPVERFSVMYPSTWAVQSDAKRASFYSTEDAKSRFIDPTSTGPLGAMMAIAFEPQGALADVNQAVQSSKDEIQGAKIEPDQSIMFSERPAVMYAYSYGVDDKTSLRGYKVFALADSTLYTFTAEGFNDRFEAYKPTMDSTFRAVRLMAPRTAATFSSAPSTTMTSVSTDHFEMEYPDNFNASFPKKAKDELAVVELKGYREDSKIRVEVTPAKKNALDKVFNTYKASYESGGQFRVKKSGELTIDGEKAMYIDLSYKKFEVDSRAYFAVKNDRVYYVFLSWYRPESNVYLPVFESSIKSLKLKG